MRVVPLLTVSYLLSHARWIFMGGLLFWGGGEWRKKGNRGGGVDLGGGGKIGRDTERSGGRQNCSQTWLQRSIVGHNLANLGCPDSTRHV